MALLIISLKRFINFQKEYELSGIILSINHFINMKKWIKISSIIVLVFTIYLAVIIVFQGLFLYYPNHTPNAHKYLKSLNEYKQVIVVNKKQKYIGWAKIDPSYEYTILYFGGMVKVHLYTLEN